MPLNLSSASRSFLIAGGITGALGFAATTYAANGTDKGASFASAMTSMRDHEAGIIGTGIFSAMLVLRSSRFSNASWSQLLGRAAGIAVGITGGVVAAKLLDHHVINRGWYKDSEGTARAEVERARTYLRTHGVEESALTDIPISADRTLHNATFMPHDFGGSKIVIGRYPNGTSYTKSADVIYHEYSHRIIDHYAPHLSFRGQAAAINEGLADSIACAIEGDNWTIGEGGGEPIRMLDDPLVMGQPATRADMLATQDPHANATIVGHASYEIARQVGADAMVDITLRALKNGRVSGVATFQTLADEERKAALQLYGPGTNGYVAVDTAWRAAGYEAGRNRVDELAASVFPTSSR